MAVVIRTESFLMKSSFVEFVLKLIGRSTCAPIDAALSLADRRDELRNNIIELVYPLSLPGTEQLALIGGPIPGDEMIVDYWFGYTGRKEDVQQLDVFDGTQVGCLDELAELLLRFQADNDDSGYLLYDPTALVDDARWDSIRRQAQLCLDALDFDSTNLETQVTETRYPTAVTHSWQFTNRKPENSG